MKLDEDDKELAAEVLSSPGWRILVHDILRKKLSKYADDLFINARKNQGLECAVAVAKRDSLFDFVETIYDAAGFVMPENIQAMKRGD